ncbi:DUF499 domain-containing protein [Candidatus Deferrimicrobium sp.]|uniref:DUF499 domain-containing protein n=1 Tax=Candidatus Deferrimicrobium sp. TaxID=3060586 RepID=UPI002ED0F0F8
MGVFAGCKPRKEVLKGELKDAIFAADFGDLISGKAPDVYGEAKTFFLNTHPAKQLCKVIEVVFGHLASSKEGGATIRLSTGFGGGKTHTLMGLWHLANNVDNLAMGTDLLPAAGRPKKVKVVSVDASKAGADIFRKHGSVVAKSLWGDIAYQLAGEKGLKSLGATDDPERQPDEDTISKLFPAGPVLFLLDELVIYMSTLSERGQGCFLAFLNQLSSIVSKKPHTALLVTDPADQRAYAKQAAVLADGLATVAVKLDDMFGRKMTDYDPIGEESAKVIARRLFESIDPAAAQAASATYHGLYQRVSTEHPGAVPHSTIAPEYAKRIVECYPFHPRLLDTAQNRLASIQAFNKSRGTLRLFARILRTVWEAKHDVELITAGEIDWSNPMIQADLLQRLNHDNFKAAISADVEGHARDLDGGAPRGIHRRVASALLLESIHMQAHSGFEPPDLTLAILRPEEAGNEPAEALERLVGVCWHTYPMAGGRGWQFRYEPNILKQIEERMGQVPIEDAKSRVLSEAQGYFTGPGFKVVNWPSSPKQVPEAADLQLVLCENEKIAKAICSNADEGTPRRFTNAIVAVTVTPAAFNNAIDRAQRLIATEALERDYQAGDQNRMAREQIKRHKPEFSKLYRVQTYRAFDRVVLAGGTAYSIDEKFQVPDEQMLAKPQGQKCLRAFLDEKDLVYQSSDSLDVDRFMKDILPGATHLDPDVYTTKATHERFLGAPGLRLIPDKGIVRNTLLTALSKGKVVVRFPDGLAYDAQGCVEGPEGRRRRIAGTPMDLPLDDTVLVSPANSGKAAEWVKEDAKVVTPPGGGTGGGGGFFEPPKPVLTRIDVTMWEKVGDFAAVGRPLLELHLIAKNPADAAVLSSLAQPLGADSLTLSVTVSGRAKDGGVLNFSAGEVKITSPVKPLAVAQTLFNSIDESGSSYEAVLKLKFGTAGRTGLGEQIKNLLENRPPGVTPRATFDKPVGGAA